MDDHKEIYILDSVMPIMQQELAHAQEGPFSYVPHTTESAEESLYIVKQQYTGEQVTPVKLDVEKAQDIDELISRFNIFNHSSNDMGVASDTTLRLSKDDAAHLEDGRYFISQRVSKKEHEGLLFIPHNEEYGDKEHIKNPWHLDCYVENNNQYQRIGDVQIIGFHIVDMQRFPNDLAYCSGYDSVEDMKSALEEINGRELQPHSLITSYFLYDFKKA